MWTWPLPRHVTGATAPEPDSTGGTRVTRNKAFQTWNRSGPLAPVRRPAQRTDGAVGRNGAGGSGGHASPDLPETPRRRGREAGQPVGAVHGTAQAMSSRAALHGPQSRSNHDGAPSTSPRGPKSKHAGPRGPRKVGSTPLLSLPTAFKESRRTRVAHGPPSADPRRAQRTGDKRRADEKATDTSETALRHLLKRPGRRPL